MLGIIQSKFALSIVTLSGIDDVPAKLVHPVTGSHLSERTCEVVAVLKAHADRTSPLWAGTAVGYAAVPDESRTTGVPKVNPVILFWPSRSMVIGTSVIPPAADPPSAITCIDVNPRRTAAGRRYGETGVGDFTGVDQAPVSGLPFAYDRLILPELSA